MHRGQTCVAATVAATIATTVLRPRVFVYNKVRFSVEVVHKNITDIYGFGSVRHYAVQLYMLF